MPGVLRRRDQDPWLASITEQFPNCAHLVRAALGAHRKRYSLLSRWYLRWFRAAGVFEIGLSLSLPVLAFVNLAMNSELIIVIVTLLLALTTALRNFFRWHENWHLFRSQELSIDILLRKWEFDLVTVLEKGPPDAIEHARNITGVFLDGLHEALRTEFDSFVDTVNTPSIPKLGPAAASSDS